MTVEHTVRVATSYPRRVDLAFIGGWVPNIINWDAVPLTSDTHRGGKTKFILKHLGPRDRVERMCMWTSIVMIITR